ncbi:response regulator [Curtanaerobium respiraculi]|uniref:response regulator n=1 Tax=Curtanaerobium respiraculi TaxID=2949669 RepID=UPI0024B3A360|nr:response regulator transcription factor [Curtanaerobium respiraculi]
MAEELIGGSSLYSKDYAEVQARLRKRSEEAVLAADAAQHAGENVRVLIVDDQDLVRNGFKLILSSYEGIKVAGEGSNGIEAYDLAVKLHPDVVLMDIRMPLEDGISATKRICADPQLADVRVLVLTTFDIDEYVYDALQAGASGFMLKDAEPDDIEHAIRAVAAGDALIEPSITKRLIETFVEARDRQTTVGDAFPELTDREREILRLVARGMGNDAIAEELVISPATVKTHVARIMGKLDAHDRAQLVVIAYERGLVKPGQK